MTAQQPVLIVIDDEPGILDVVGRFAARSGFQVIACAGGREGRNVDVEDPALVCPLVYFA